MSRVEVKVLLFVHPGNYRKRFDWFGVADRTIDVEMPRQIEGAYARAVATVR